MTKTKIKRVGSGKIKGATSFVTVTLKDLCAKIDPSTPLKVSRIQLQTMGYILAPNSPQPVILTDNHNNQSNAVSAKVTDFDEPVINSPMAATV